MMVKKDSPLVIVNADDFGLNAGINQGIIRAHREGIVSSTSLMVRQPAVLDAVSLAGENPNLSIGLHLDFGEWTLRGSEWESRYVVVDINDLHAVEDECERQLSHFHSLLGRMPNHIDSHQHVHNRESLRSISMSLARRYGVPVRHLDAAPVYCGEFYGQAEDGSTRCEWITAKALCGILSRIDARATEVCCHPSLESTPDTMYSEERIHELRALCDPDVREFLASSNLKLCSFEEYSRLVNSESFSQNT